MPLGLSAFICVYLRINLQSSEQDQIMKLDSNAKGVYVIAPTPFHPDGRIDESSIDRMTDFFLKAGVTGMTVLGQLGEAPKLEHAESVGVVKRGLKGANVSVGG